MEYLRPVKPYDEAKSDFIKKEIRDRDFENEKDRKYVNTLLEIEEFVLGDLNPKWSYNKVHENFKKDFREEYRKISDELKSGFYEENEEKYGNNSVEETEDDTDEKRKERDRKMWENI